MQELSNIKTRKITLGTKEWADSNVNCYIGCSNNCRYCYAKNMAIRFKRKTEVTWKYMEPNQKNIDKKYGKRRGRVMFPTSHDITSESLEGCLTVLKKLIDADNNVLITTKPKLNCVMEICDLTEKVKNFIQFRFTITSMNDKILKFWEPGAPLFKERFESLKYAYRRGFKTSISIEPFLDKDPLPLIKILLPYVTESIWIGKMNYIKANDIPSNFRKDYISIREVNSKNNLKAIIEKLHIFPKSLIHLKDSIENYLSH